MCCIFTYYLFLNILFLCIPGPLNDECPVGHYCPEGSDEPIACPEGTFNPTIKLIAEEQCLNCTAGQFCNETGKAQKKENPVLRVRLTQFFQIGRLFFFFLVFVVY